MSDKNLNLLIKIAAAFLVVSVAFCAVAVCMNIRQKKTMEEQRLENETKLAELQLPSIEPEEETVFTLPPEEEGKDGNKAPAAVPEEDNTQKQSVAKKGKIIVLDAGHGKSSSAMTADEKTAEGYEYNESRGGWGEWRHYKNGTFGEDCHGSGCTELCPANASCWYSMGAGDRDDEPEIDLNNALAAQKYLEEMGYTVRMTRTSNEQNPSMNKRVSYCFPNNDTSEQPDAELYVCIHSNAGGGRGTSYISLAGPYRQSFIGDDYITESNKLGNIINTKVAETSGLKANSPISSPYLILFNKCPVTIAYMEIGFFDNDSDMAILNSSSDEIGRAIAEGIDEYLSN